MDYELGVLLYHCTEYGRADFSIQGCVQGLLNALASKLVLEEVKNGFISEAQNYGSYEELSASDWKNLFVEAYNDLVPCGEEIRITEIISRINDL